MRFIEINVMDNFFDISFLKQIDVVLNKTRNHQCLSRFSLKPITKCKYYDRIYFRHVIHDYPHQLDLALVSLNPYQPCLGILFALFPHSLNSSYFLFKILAYFTVSQHTILSIILFTEVNVSLNNNITVFFV